MELRFTKMHGLGNDFILIEDLEGVVDIDPDAVAYFCDRNFGIGADGLMIVRPATVPQADYSWVFFNADGSVAEMCGNGIRCFARYVWERMSDSSGSSVTVETARGLMAIDIISGDDGEFDAARVDMGEPVLEPALIPTTLPAGPGSAAVVAYPLAIDGHTVPVTCVSMGNPHCVTWVEDVDEAPVGELGPLIEVHDAFPRKTNVEFAQVVDRSTLRLRVWERACGETMACGTGACATVVAGVLEGKVDRGVTVELPGGDLEIEFTPQGRVYMTGGAEIVFDGSVEVAEY